MDITELLTFAHREGASDVHLSAGEPPRLRIHGDMKKLEHEALTAEQVHEMVFDIMPDNHRRGFEETSDADFRSSWASWRGSVSTRSANYGARGRSSG